MYTCTGYDDLVADCIFSLNDIVTKRTLPPRWVPSPSPSPSPNYNSNPNPSSNPSPNTGSTCERWSRVRLQAGRAGLQAGRGEGRASMPSS